MSAGSEVSGSRQSQLLVMPICPSSPRALKRRTASACASSTVCPARYGCVARLVKGAPGALEPVP